MIHEREHCTIKRLKHIEDVIDLLTLPRFQAQHTPEGLNLKPANIGSAAVQRAEITYWPRPVVGPQRHQLEGNLTTDTVYSLGVSTIPDQYTPLDYLICTSTHNVTDPKLIADEEINVVNLQDLLYYKTQEVYD